MPLDSTGPDLGIDRSRAWLYTVVVSVRDKSRNATISLKQIETEAYNYMSTALQQAQDCITNMANIASRGLTDTPAASARELQKHKALSNGHSLHADK
jgi:hypothetical protein